jgi:seryl-tRNA synthetase
MEAKLKRLKQMNHDLENCTLEKEHRALAKDITDTLVKEDENGQKWLARIEELTKEEAVISEEIAKIEVQTYPLYAKLKTITYEKGDLKYQVLQLGDGLFEVMSHPELYEKQSVE